MTFVSDAELRDSGSLFWCASCGALGSARTLSHERTMHWTVPSYEREEPRSPLDAARAG